MNLLQRGLLLAIGLAVVISVRAERIDAPLELLHDPINLLVAGKAVEISPATSRVVFECKAILAGNRKFVTQDLIETRVPPEVLPVIVEGHDYIFGYTLFSENPHRPGKLVGKRLGATLLVSPGLEPALFDDTAEVRRILDAGASEHRRESQKTLRLLVATLKSGDPALVNLAANQLALEPEFRTKFTLEDRHAIEAFVRDGDSPARARTPLLEAAAQHSEAFGPDWAIDTSKKLLSTTPVSGFENRTSDLKTLLRVAFSLLEGSPVALPQATLERWVAGDSLVLTEPALRLLHRQFPEAERSAIETAMRDAGTPQQIRDFLRGYLARMDRVRAMGDAKKK